ncbi:TonB family protein [Parerythrobacter jejuensis]|uniref:TonB family protein n=1 Tax=Parerythrobacter jejuensis TaxID=795812 RepID=A0A845AN65_9SPHN|nr:TonB family protein [Parerythrobacter jejuensis]MXP31720.1 TonB family protein [Parerythrobacter jejuensis]
MAFTDSNNTSARAPAVIGVAAIHAVLGLALVTGLAGGVYEKIVEERIIGHNFKKPPPPKPPEPKPVNDPQASTAPKVFTPAPPFQLDPQPPVVDTTDVMPDPMPLPMPNAGPIPSPSPGLGTGPAPAAVFDPVAPKPRNDPGRWITDSDYRSSWINREWAGTAGFRLSIGANGRVQECTVVDSTGHPALDAATCKLVRRRARFEAALNDKGEKVPGTFSSAVRWQIPE